VTFTSLIIFAAVYFVAVATPGPGVAALVARVLGQGLEGVAQTFAGVFVAIKFAGAAYLLYLAWRMATAPLALAYAPPPASRGWRAFLTSLSLTLGNPKVMVFFLSIMPLVVDVRTLTLPALLEIGAVCGVVIFLTLALYALAANRARAFLSSTRAMKFVHRAAGGLMAGAAVAVAAR